jgi:hypothetical protein
VDEVKIPKGLRELYADCLADDSRAMRTTTSKFMAELIERIVRAEAQVAEADFNFGGWRAIKKRLEEQVAALEAQLKALDWTPITAENLPKKGDILAKFRKTKTGKPMGWCFTLDYWDNFNALRLRGWTHFRPINPPHAGGSNV